MMSTCQFTICSIWHMTWPLNISLCLMFSINILYVMAFIYILCYDDYEDENEDKNYDVDDDDKDLLIGYNKKKKKKNVLEE